MSADQKKTPGSTPSPASSGSGAGSALEAMIKKRPPRPGQGEPAGQTQSQEPEKTSQ